MGMEYEAEDNKLSQAIEHLPSLSPKEGTWDGIESQLEKAAVSNKKRIPYHAIAAVILVVLTTPIVILSLRTTMNESIKLSEEFDIQEEFSPHNLLEDADFDEFLVEECGDIRPVCEDESLIQLLDQLEALRSEAIEMVELINDTGYDQYLMKVRSRLEHENVEVKREIMALLRG